MKLRSVPSTFATSVLVVFLGLSQDIWAQEPSSGQVQVQVEVEEEEVPAEDVEVQAESEGASTEEVEVEVGGDAAPSEEAPEEVVVVTGTRASRIAGAVQVIGERQLERQEYDDPAAVLRQVPGVAVREEDGIGLRPNIAMRGTNPDRSRKVTLMEDGILFGPAPYSAPAAYYFPLMTRMTQVRVIKGPGAIAFGPQTVAGAVDLISRPIPSKETGHLDVAYGQWGYRKTHAYAGASTDKFGVLVEGVYLANDGFKELPDGASTGSGRGDFVVKANYVVDPYAPIENQFSIKLNYSREASNETYLGLTDADFDEDPNRRYPASSLDRMDNHRTGLALTHELTDFQLNAKLRTTFYRNDFSRSWRKLNRIGGAQQLASVLATPESPENAEFYGILSGVADSTGPPQNLWIGPNQRDYVSQGIYSRFRWEGNTGALQHKFEAGLRLHNDSVQRHHSEDEFAMIGGELFPTGEATLITTRNRAETYALALHFADAIAWKRLTVTPGVRLELIQSNAEDFIAETGSDRLVTEVLPGLGTYFALTEDWGVLGGVHRGFSPPAPGSPDTIKPESSINYEAGTRYSHRRSRAELVGFFNDYSNLTDVCTFSSGCLNADLDRQFDAGEARVFGLEAAAAHDLPLGEVVLPLFATYTLSYGEFDSSFQSADPIYGTVVEGDEIPYLPRHQASAQVALEWRRWGAHTLFTYVAPFRELAGSDPLSEVPSTDPLYRLDLGASYQIFDILEAYINARNVLDYQGIMARRPFGARPNAPRWIQGGLKLHID